MIAVSNEGTGYFDGGFFMLPPAGVTPTQQQIEATSQAVIEGQAAAARARGWRIYAGDQTSFREARYTRLWPFALDGQTYFMASWAAPWANPRKIILRPTPAGLLEEVCVFELRH